MPDTAPALVATDVTCRYGAVTAVDSLSLEVHSGEWVALVGESGSGKTTLLRCFNALLLPARGTVTVGGENVIELDPIALRRRIGYVPQDGGLLPHWRVTENAALVPRLRGASEPRRAAEEALMAVGLDPATFGARWPAELSGGQRQRVAIARALAAAPGCILLDEPFGALDAITRGELHALMRQLRGQLPLTAILVTHDLREAILLADRIAVMRSGGIEQIATPNDMLAAPATAYVADLLARSGVSS
ncbi:MAG: ATP-binding cassette domain-containing protein [Gemmatimonadota bacterium]